LWESNFQLNQLNQLKVIVYSNGILQVENCLRPELVFFLGTIILTRWILLIKHLKIKNKKQILILLTIDIRLEYYNS